MVDFTTYKNLKVLDTDPTAEPGGQALNDNFKAIADFIEDAPTLDGDNIFAGVQTFQDDISCVGFSIGEDDDAVTFSYDTDFNNLQIDKEVQVFADLTCSSPGVIRGDGSGITNIAGSQITGTINCNTITYDGDFNLTANTAGSIILNGNGADVVVDGGGGFEVGESAYIDNGGNATFVSVSGNGSGITGLPLPYSLNPNDTGGIGVPTDDGAAFDVSVINTSTYLITADSILGSTATVTFTGSWPENTNCAPLNLILSIDAAPITFDISSDLFALPSGMPTTVTVTDLTGPCVLSGFMWAIPNAGWVFAVTTLAADMPLIESD